MEFDFEIPPHPTVVKGVAMSPEPTIRFKLPPSEDYRALQKLFQVTCTLADVHHVEKGIKPNDVGFAKFQEQLTGATANLQFDAVANSYVAVFSNLKINISGYHVFENGKFKKKSKSHFATRYLIFIINFTAPQSAPVVIFQQNFAVDVHQSFCNIGTRLVDAPASLASFTLLFIGLLAHLLGPKEIVLRFIAPSTGVAGQANKAFVAGSGFGAPSFVFFGESMATVDSQDLVMMNCRTPKDCVMGIARSDIVPASFLLFRFLFFLCDVEGETPVVLYVGGIPSNRDRLYTFTKNGRGVGVKIPIPDDPNFDQGFPKYNSSSCDWEYAHLRIVIFC